MKTGKCILCNYMDFDGNQSLINKLTEQEYEVLKIESDDEFQTHYMILDKLAPDLDPILIYKSTLAVIVNLDNRYNIGILK